MVHFGQIYSKSSIELLADDPNYFPPYKCNSQPTPKVNIFFNKSRKFQ